MAGDDVTIVITAHNGDAVRAFRDTEGRLRDMRGRFAAEGSIMSRAMNQVTASIGGVRGALIPLATAAVPLGAALAPIAAKAGAAGVAVAAFGAAAAGQVSALSDAADAQKKYGDAVDQYGRGSKQAAEAQRSLSNTLSRMPQATARAAVAVSTLKGEFRAWSDDLAGFTMVPVEKSVTLLGQAIPKLTPMVKGASAQLDRLVTVAGGAMASPGFDALADKVSTFANQSLKEAVDGAIHFTRALSEGNASGPIKSFMEYAEKNGPALRETLHNVGDAVSTLVEASADAGPGMLTLVNAAAKLVASLPPELVTTLMQMAIALKAVRIAGAGAAAIAGGVATLGTRIAALRAASAAAGGGMAGLSAAFGTLSTAAKATLIASGIGVLLLALSELSAMGKQAPPDVDKLTTSLRTLADTGKVTGEASRAFGKDLSGLSDSFQKALDPKGLDKFQQSIVSFFGTDSTPVKEAKENIDAVDKALANLVKNGQADLAATALETLSKKMKDQGFSSKEISSQMDDYKAALADAAFEQQLAIQSMGIFGQAAQDTSAKLDAQKGAADGLRASIIALNDANRSAYDAQIQYEGSLDNLTKSFKDNGATLDLNTEKGRANGQAMSEAAKSQDEFIAAGVAAGESLGSMTKKSDELRATMLKLATEAFDGNKQKATEYVNTLLGVPGDIKTLVRLERQEAVSGLGEVAAAIRATPDAKTIEVDALNGAAIKALNDVGIKTKALPNGKTQVTVAGGALGTIDAIRRAMNNLNGKKATTWTYHNVRTTYSTAGSVSGGKSVHDMVGATGGLFTGKKFRYADGGPVQGPGTGTSDDVFAPWLSNGEFVMKKAAVDRYGEKFMQAVNDGKIVMPKYAKGGKVSQATKDARAALSSSFNISRFGAYAGYQRDPFEKSLGDPSDVGSLVSSLNQLRGQIKAAFSGGTESRLLKNLDMWGKGLIRWEKQLNSVTKSLDSAKSKLNDLKSAASQLASSVKGGVLSSANITKGASGDGPVTTASIMSGLVASRDKATAFAGALKGLKAKGLRSDLIQQIGEAGIEGGGLETAGALLGASSSEISSVNSLQAQIASAAGSAGKATADAVYAAQIRAQDALVKKLDRQQDRLVAAMGKLATNIEKLLKQALKGKAAGGIVGAAASGGVRSGLTWVGEHEPELLDLPSGSRVWSGPDSKRMQRQAWASMLTAPPANRRAAPSAAGLAGGGGQPIVIQLAIGKQQFGELWVDVGRNEVRARGSIEATLKPPRGR